MARRSGRRVAAAVTICASVTSPTSLGSSLSSSGRRAALQHGHRQRPAEHGVGVAQQMGGDPGLGARELAGREAVGGQPVDLLVDRAQHLVGVAAGRHVRLQQQRGRVAHVELVAHEADVPADAGHRAVPLDEPLDQPGGVAVGEHLGQHHVRQVVGEAAIGSGTRQRGATPGSGASRSV